MGYKNELFEEQVDDELKCPICECVLENAVQGVDCEHLFCLDCIQQRLQTCSAKICPLDRSQLAHLKSPPKIILKLLNNLKIKCNFSDNGCAIKLKLSELNQHSLVCLFNPAISNVNAFEKTRKLELNKIENKLSNLREIKRFRIAGDLSVQIDEMNKIVNELTNDLQDEHRQSIEFTRNLEITQRNYDNLNVKFKQIVNPFLNLLKSNFNQSDEETLEKENYLKMKNSQLTNESNEESDNQKCTAVIRNLNEFLNEQILDEYLRQNRIRTLAVQQELSVFKRSKDFKITILKNDFHRLFNENLWPTGVTCHNLTSSNKDNLIIFGRRQTDLPCLLVIKSGLALSYY